MSFGLSYLLHAAAIVLALGFDVEPTSRTRGGPAQQPRQQVTLTMVPAAAPAPPTPITEATRQPPEPNPHPRTNPTPPTPPPTVTPTEATPALARGTPIRPAHPVPNLTPREPTVGRPAQAISSNNQPDPSDDTLGPAGEPDDAPQPPAPTDAARKSTERAPDKPTTDPAADASAQGKPPPDASPDPAPPSAPADAAPQGPHEEPAIDVVHDPDAVDQPIRFAREVRPQRSTMSRRLGEVGIVRFEVVVDAEGELTDHTLLTPGAPDRLIDAATDALFASRWLPAERDGEPVIARRIVEYRFTP